jgi:regulator of sigma E protease
VPDIVVFVLVIGTLIIGHELGHFLTARLLGVQVDEFGFGFPPRLLTLFHAAGTRFSLNWIPFGGFVRIAGENDPEVEGGLASSSKRVRTAVLLAGPLANVFLAIFAFSLAYRFAAPDISKVLITDVAEDTPAFSAGILPGDVVLSVDRVSINSFDSMVDAVTDRVGTETELQMDRDGEIISVFLTPRETFPDDQGPLGVSLGNPSMIMPWGQAINFGLQSTWSQFEGILQLPGRLLSGNIEPEDARLSGLKGMYDMIAWAGSIDRSSQRPFLTLNLIGVISVGLAIANLLPFPALDGGRLVFVFLELILRKRIEPRYEGLAHTIGFGLLLVILIYVNLLDFIRPISLP